MTSSVYDALRDCSGQSLEQIRKIIDDLSIDCFNPLWTPKDGNVDFTYKELPAVIMYLIHAYSSQSKMLVFGSDFIDEKKRIAEKMQLPEYLHGKVLKLKSAAFRDAMLRYLDYQGSRTFKHLQKKKDMYEASEDSNFNLLFTEEDAINSKSIQETNKIKDVLLKEIKTLEDQLRSEFKFVFDNREDAQQAVIDAQRSGIDNGNLENSQWIDFNRKKNENIPKDVESV